MVITVKAIKSVALLPHAAITMHRLGNVIR